VYSVTLRAHVRGSPSTGRCIASPRWPLSLQTRRCALLAYVGAGIAVYVAAVEFIPRLRRPRTIWEAAERGSVAAVERFLAAGASASVTDADGCTPLHQAAAPDVARLLLAHGADVNARDETGWTPLFSAAMFGNSAVAELLLARGADPNHRAGDDQTPLHVAAWEGLSGLVRSLLKAGVAVDARDGRGFTPLHSAADRRDPGREQRDIFELLLGAGADVNARAANGKTPLDLAEEQDWTGLPDLLRARGGKRSQEAGH
jgi:ankyrin repeat protein